MPYWLEKNRASMASPSPARAFSRSSRASPREAITGPSRPACRSSSTPASVVGLSKRARSRGPSAPARAAWAVSVSRRASAVLEWVFMHPAAALISLPRCPTTSTERNPAPAAWSMAAPR